MKPDYIASRRSLIDRNGFALSMTYGSSMRPLIWGGIHCVAVVPIDGEPKVGDLLMFMQRRDGKEINVVHRLVGIRRREDGVLYVTRGDNCLGSETVSPSRVIGRVAEVHRVSGFRPWLVIPWRKFSVTDRSYRLYSRLWTSIWPLRRILYLVRARLCSAHARLVQIIKEYR